MACAGLLSFLPGFPSPTVNLFRVGVPGKPLTSFCWAISILRQTFMSVGTLIQRRMLHGNFSSSWNVCWTSEREPWRRASRRLMKRILLTDIHFNHVTPGRNSFTCAPGRRNFTVIYRRYQMVRDHFFSHVAKHNTVIKSMAPPAPCHLKPLQPLCCLKIKGKFWNTWGRPGQCLRPLTSPDDWAIQVEHRFLFTHICSSCPVVSMNKVVHGNR